jgi:hypothetical protein
MITGLRNEDYVAFLDESGDESGRRDLQVVAGVLIPARWLRSAERRWQDFIRDNLGSRSGQTEVKARELTHGEGVALHAQTKRLAAGFPALSAKGAGRQFYRDALEHIAGIAEVRVLTVGLPTKHPIDVYRLWVWMASAIMVERPRAPRPRLPLSVIDGQDRAFRGAHELTVHRFYKQFPHCQPYVARGNRWFVGGSVLQDSNLHPFVQMADLVAAAGRHAISAHPIFGAWYQVHLRDHAERIGYGRAVDVSAHALAQLRRRSRHDACGSGWPAAMLVP